MEWARIAGLDDIEWSSECAGRDGPEWDRLESVPRAGERVVQISSWPLPASEHWALFRPALSSLNGWDEYPQELTRSCVVRCAHEVALGSRDWGVHGVRWQALVHVVESIALPELAARFAPDRSGEVPELPGRIRRFEHGDFTVVSGNLEGDVDGYRVLQRFGGRVVLILCGQSDFTDSRFHAGHRPV
jgi:hypothetical protein